MLAWAPGFIKAGTVVDALVRNIDIAPTLLELTKTTAALEMDGVSFLPLLTGAKDERDREFIYQYYWESAFPHTPTTFALRTDQYKFIWYHGIWDLNELYDLKADPKESHNLIEVPHYKSVVEEMRKRLFDWLESSGAMQIPLRRASWQADERLQR
jgi:arylsulfatase A-like enzyme